MNDELRELCRELLQFLSLFTLLPADRQGPAESANADGTRLQWNTLMDSILARLEYALPHLLFVSKGKNNGKIISYSFLLIFTFPYLVEFDRVL